MKRPETAYECPLPRSLPGYPGVKTATSLGAVRWRDRTTRPTAASGQPVTIREQCTRCHKAEAHSDVPGRSEWKARWMND